MYNNAEVVKEYNEWEQLVNNNMGQFNAEWPGCDECEGEMDCGQCGWNLVGLEEQSPEFLERVKVMVEGCVEELYVRPDLTPDEEAELGVFMAHLVKVYCKYFG